MSRSGTWVTLTEGATRRSRTRGSSGRRRTVRQGRKSSRVGLPVAGGLDCRSDIACGRTGKRAARFSKSPFWLLEVGVHGTDECAFYAVFRNFGLPQRIRSDMGVPWGYQQTFNAERRTIFC
ncbi:MAG TPA: hypothetical protein VMW73_01125 [Spirochaetia bacterium]|nr:hypothetical protein [Spirochaetia bacterium]